MAVQAVSFGGVPGSESVATQRVFARRHGLQVRRIYAAFVFALVVDLIPVRDCADREFVHNPMAGCLGAIRLAPRDVPARTHGSGPVPAHFITELETEGVKELSKASLRSTHERRI